MGTTRRRELEMAHTRTDIIRAAAKAFAHHGFDAATVHDIAKEAGYSTQSLYSYFKGKQEIVEALVSTMGGELEATFNRPTPSGLTFAQKLELLLQRWAEFAERWREALMVLFALKASIARESSRKAAKFRTLHPDYFVQHLSAWIRGAATPVEIGGHDPEDVAYILKGILVGCFSQWLRGGQQDPLSDHLELIRNVFLFGISGGAGGKAGREASRKGARRGRGRPRR